MNTEEMRRPLELQFAEESFTLRPFTVDQIIAFEDLFSPSEIGKTTTLHQSREALKIALSEDHADVDVSKVRVTAMELAKALGLILVHAGFTEPTPGEAQAAA